MLRWGYATQRQAVFCFYFLCLPKAMSVKFPLDEMFEYNPEFKDLLLKIKEAFGPITISELHLDRDDGAGMVQIHPDPNKF
jgi:hypothetical protein